MAVIVLATGLNALRSSNGVYCLRVFFVFFRNQFLWALGVLILVSGCSYYPIYYKTMPAPLVESRIHPSLGATILNHSGRKLSDYEWERNWEFTAWAYLRLKKCATAVDEDIETILDKRLGSTPIVLMPPGPIDLPGKKSWASTDLEYIYISIDNFFDWYLRNEWIHIYLHLSGKDPWGDPGHSHVLFEKCGHIKF